MIRRLILSRPVDWLVRFALRVRQSQLEVIAEADRIKRWAQDGRPGQP